MASRSWRAFSPTSLASAGALLRASQRVPRRHVSTFADWLAEDLFASKGGTAIGRRMGTIGEGRPENQTASRPPRPVPNAQEKSRYQC